MVNKPLFKSLMGLILGIIIGSVLTFRFSSNNNECIANPQQKTITKFVGRSGEYKIYKLKVENGWIYEYHCDPTTYDNKARGFRIVFVPDEEE